MKSLRIIGAGFACGVALGAAVRAAAQAPEVAVRAVAEYTAVRPGTPFRVAVRLAIPEGWHIYWTNPGPGGLPTAMAWHLPAGVQAGPTDWPYPETDESAADVTNVYRGTVVTFSTFQAQPDASGALRLTADLSWGICKAVCIQQRRSVFVVLRAGPGAPDRSPGWSEMEAARSRLPVRQPDAQFAATAHGETVTLTAIGLKGGPPAGSWVTFFPARPGRKSAVAQVKEAGGGIAVTLPQFTTEGATPNRLDGVLVAAHAPGALPPVRAIAVDVAVMP
jgi:thiol:disulfide interchange protein DsbD